MMEIYLHYMRLGQVVDPDFGKAHQARVVLDHAGMVSQGWCDSVMF